MEVVFIYERENLLDFPTQLKNGLVDRIESAFNLTNRSKTENLILPVVPKISFPKNTKVDNYEGLTQEYNIPNYENLSEITWSSIFPVNKNYKFQHIGSNNNGYDYVKFLQRRLHNQLPFRLLAYDMAHLVSGISGAISDTINNSSNNVLSNAFEVHFDGYVIVEKFEFNTDNAKDIAYTLTLKQFVNNSNYLIDFTDLGVTVAKNLATKYALKGAGLI